MIPTIREKFNQQFTQEKYQAFLESIWNKYNHKPPFRIAETPIFIPKLLKDRLIEACNDINEVICQPNFKEITHDAIKHETLQVPGEDYHTRFLQMDFGICHDEKGDLFPQLIEVQGFPSLYFFQEQLASAYCEHFEIPSNFKVHLQGMQSKEYIQLLSEIIVGENDPKHVVLLEVEPEKQTTYIDFLRAHDYLGIKVLCISNMKKRGKDLYYLDEDGNEVHIQKIYNRVIFDELNQRHDIKREFYFKDDVNVEWVGHPNWFFRISKYTLPLLKSKYVPNSFFLNDLEHHQINLADYVLKPLYSFAGAGVKLNIDKEILNSIEDKDNYILQKKVKYEPVIQTLNDPAKCEIRMLMLWQKGERSATIVNNLVRLSKGEMVGVRYNKDKDWVGASVGFFEE